MFLDSRFSGTGPTRHRTIARGHKFFFKGSRTNKKLEVFNNFFFSADFLKSRCFFSSTMPRCSSFGVAIFYFCLKNIRVPLKKFRICGMKEELMNGLTDERMIRQWERPKDG